jgi:ADP-dependent NAD(P)H-hydrate dehydratase
MSEPTEVTAGVLRSWPLPEPGSDKESRGTVLVVGGSTQTAGAVLLAGEAALRAGGGKLQLATARGVAGPLGIAVPEARVLMLAESDDGQVDASAAADVTDAATSASVVLLGPGLPEPGTAVALLEGIVPHLDTVLVVDALASAYVTEHPDGLRHLEGRCVLTVNPGELARVLGRDDEEIDDDPLRHTRDAAAMTGAVVLCGSTEKYVVRPDGRAWVIRTGGPGLGVSGSGDVQGGIVSGLLARGADAAQAAVWGGYLHGRTGEELAVELGPVGYLARELPGRLPGLLAELTG